MQDILEQPITIRRVIILCALLFVLFALRTLLFSPAPFVPTFPNKETQKPATVTLSEPNLKQAESANLMGALPEEPKVVDQPVDEPKAIQEPAKPQKQPLNVRILGLISSTEEDLNFVILQEGGKKQKSYSIGEELEDGETIVKEIDHEKIVFDRDGAEEVAYLYKPAPRINAGFDNSPEADPFDDQELGTGQSDDIQLQIQNTDPFYQDGLDNEIFPEEDPSNIQYNGPSIEEQQAEAMLENGFTNPDGTEYIPPAGSSFDPNTFDESGGTVVEDSFFEDTEPEFENQLEPSEEYGDPFAEDDPNMNSNFQ